MKKIRKWFFQDKGSQAVGMLADLAKRISGSH